MQIDKVVNTIKSESSGFYLFEITNNESISYLEKQILNSFYEKQYEIDTSFITLEPEEKSKFITIDQIRKIKKEFLYKNVLNLSKVIFVREVNYLNINALNGLLKIIEEIPLKTYFIFCSSNLISLPETIISRARVIRDLNTQIYSNDFNSMKEDIVRQNQNISEELINSIINPFINLKSIDFFEKVKLFNKDQLNVCSLIFLRILNHYLKGNLNNKKLYKYLLKLHSDYLNDVDESYKFNTLTNDLISIYFTRLNSNLIKYV
tara:strand:- start:82 stop:870 length:789 start_codon:yes stop_codon:yes gene_type:complete